MCCCLLPRAPDPGWRALTKGCCMAFPPRFLASVCCVSPVPQSLLSCPTATSSSARDGKRRCGGHPTPTPATICFSFDSWFSGFPAHSSSQSRKACAFRFYSCLVAGGRLRWRGRGQGVQRATESRQPHQEEVGKREYIPTADGSYRVSGDFLGAPPVCPAFSASLWANL